MKVTRKTEIYADSVEVVFYTGDSEGNHYVSDFTKAILKETNAVSVSNKEVYKRIMEDRYKLKDKMQSKFGGRIWGNIGFKFTIEKDEETRRIIIHLTWGMQKLLKKVKKWVEKEEKRRRYHERIDEEYTFKI